MSSINPRTYVAFLGLGVMGGPMAGHLAKAGHTSRSTTARAAKAQAWAAEFKGRPSRADPARSRGRRDIVFCCVGNDDDLRSVVLGDDGAFAGMKKGATFVDHTTASADVARELSKAAQARACSSSTPRSRAARPAPRTAC
jgi:3-hydroxyisobutyrate dehydrogenase-like beta-hydroxyacid dehydrogenase